MHKLIFPLPTGIGDLFDVVSKLQHVTARWRNLGLALRLHPHTLEIIEKDSGKKSSTCLLEVLTKWLKKNYDTEKYGEPSWKSLAKAVAHPSGGNDSALAKEISEGM